MYLVASRRKDDDAALLMPMESPVLEDDECHCSSQADRRYGIAMR